MHRVAEDFYTSLGYDPLPDTFWEKSMITKPTDREVVCHASAWDFNNNDLRIKMCTAVTGIDMQTIHHEQGHLFYDHYYRKQPKLYREGAADFFHEVAFT
jgi:peptidyl-dipeptidase A